MEDIWIVYSETDSDPAFLGYVTSRTRAVSECLQFAKKWWNEYNIMQDHDTRYSLNSGKCRGMGDHNITATLVKKMK